MVDDADARGIIERARDEGRVRLLYTHVTMDELVATPDLGRRRDSLTRSRPSQRRCQRGPSSSTCHAAGKQGSARTQKPFETLGGLRHAKDALIATTAQFESALFITSDRRAAGRARDVGIDVCGMGELLKP